MAAQPENRERAPSSHWTSRYRSRNSMTCTTSTH